jgi:hypothetical protein
MAERSRSARSTGPYRIRVSRSLSQRLRGWVRGNQPSAKIAASALDTTRGVRVMAHNPEYFTKYANLHMERTASGVLTLRFHTNGGPITFTGKAHEDLPKALAEIGDDRDNKVLIITGTGENFMDDIDGASLGEIFKPAVWDKIFWEGGASCSGCWSWRRPLSRRSMARRTCTPSTPCSPTLSSHRTTRRLWTSRTSGSTSCPVTAFT